MKHRLTSIDALRGLVMIIMALDHTREFFHADALLYQPEDLTRTTAILFFTRWITHICAPTFMFTAGLGAYFWMRRGHTTGELSRFLWSRGLWLVLLELILFRFTYDFTFSSGLVILSVLWALGWSMVALGFLVHLRIRVIAILSVAMIVLHNLADPVKGGGLWNILHRPGVFTIGSTPILAAYPLIPWIGVMAAGFCFAEVMSLDEERRRRMLFRIGAALVAGFLGLRALNFYGDPSPWKNGILSLLRTTKYPPSLDFLLMTLGPAILLLALFDRRNFSRNNPLIVFGRVPLFYFLGHFFLIHCLQILFAYVRYGAAPFLFTPVPTMGGPAQLYPPGFGYPLWVVYLVYAVVVLAMYPLCRWFAGVKARRSHWLLSYL